MRLRVFPKTLQTQKDILNFRLLYKLRISFDITRIFAEQGIQESLLSLKLSLLCKQNVFFSGNMAEWLTSFCCSPTRWDTSFGKKRSWTNKKPSNIEAITSFDLIPDYLMFPNLKITSITKYSNLKREFI